MKNKYNAVESTKIKYISDILDFCASNYGDEPAFTYPVSRNENAEKSYRSLRKESLALAAALESFGCKGERIAIIGENCIEWIEAFFAVSCVAGTVVPLDRENSTDDLASLIKRSRSRAVMYSPAYKDKADILKEKFANIEFICFSDFEKLITQFENSAKKYPIMPAGENSPAMIVFTSGTMGDSKGVVLSHKNVVSDALSGCEIIGECKKEVLVLPLHHTFGLITGVIGPLIIKVNIFISNSVRHFQKDMERFKPDIIFVVPVIAETLYKKVLAEAEKQGNSDKLEKGLKISAFLRKIGIDRRRKIFSNVIEKFGGELKTIICGGAPVCENAVRGLCDFGIETRSGYGITECSPIVSVNLCGKSKNKIGSAGPAISCCNIRVKNPDKNGIGDIEVKGSNIMLGYLDDEAGTREAFDGDWFKTGDIGYLDRDGYLFLTGRKKNLIILSNGKNVSPEELEEKLIENELIKEIVVFEKDGRICAEIYPGADFDYSDEKPIFDIIDTFNRTVPPYKNIEKIVVRKTEFPKTTTMKIKRNVLDSERNCAAAF